MGGAEEYDYEGRIGQIGRERRVEMVARRRDGDVDVMHGEVQLEVWATTWWASTKAAK